VETAPAATRAWRRFLSIVLVSAAAVLVCSF